MRILLRNNLNPVSIAVSLAVTFALGVFCYFTRLSMILPLLFLFSGWHLAYFEKARFRVFLNLGLLLALLLYTAYALTQYNLVSHYYIPVAAVAMLAVLFYNDLQLGFVISFVSSVMVGLVVGGDFNLMLTFFVGSLTASYCIRGARTRGDLILAGFLVGVAQVACIVLFNPFSSFIFSKYFLTNHLKPLMVNGFVSAGLVFIAPFFERFFGVLTNFSLLELSDSNQPLLKRMVIEAPGTYHHSLVVGNLAEAAGNAVDANGLLARVGGYYHDVGKIIKPEYFNENQIVDGNKHDNLEPTMSRLVILNHVKEGVDLARKYKLDQHIIDFIPQHHGTSLIHYFYQRALEGAQEGEAVEEENFRYPGPKPQTRETAIVLLADSVEGAVRALDDPTPGRINELVKKVINNKFIDGQLDECDLTLKDIEKISETFGRVLSAMHHGRVKYPEKKNGNGHSHKKSAESDAPLPPAHHPDRKKNPSA